MHRDFFIVLDLRLTKIGSKALLPFAFLGVTPPNNRIANPELKAQDSFFMLITDFLLPLTIKRSQS